MKEYKFVLLNEALHLSRKKDLADVEEITNKLAREGWELQQIFSPDDSMGSIMGVFFREVY